MFKKIFTAAILIICALLLVLLPKNFALEVKEKILLCTERVIPSLFLFMVLSNFAINSGALEPVTRLFSPVMKLFGLSKNCFEALFWGSFSGFPIGARLTSSLFEKGRITKSEGENLLSFCNNCSPAFLMGMLNENGLKIYLIQLICALLTGLYICKKERAAVKVAQEKEEYLPLAKSFVSAVKTSALGIINVCAFIIFMAFVTVILKLLNISHPLIIGFFEITSGISAIPYITPFYFACICFIAGLGSLSVYLQSLVFANEAGLSMKKYIPGKGINGILCFFAGYTYCIKRLYLFIGAVIIIVFLHKIGKTLFGEKNADRQFSKKHRAYKKENEKQLNL